MNCAFITIGVTQLHTDDYVNCLPRKLHSNIISYAPKNVTSKNQRRIYRATSRVPSNEPILPSTGVNRNIGGKSEHAFFSYLEKNLV